MKPQTQQVLNWLKTQGPIDSLTALRRLGSFRLAARIGELREAGIPVKTTLKHTKGGARVAVYSL